MKRLRLIDLLAANYPDIGRERLGAFIACHNVTVGGQICADGKMLFPEDSPVSFTFEKYCSRGGYKLEHALSTFGLDVTGLCMLDAGSSTGGFTDCLLQHGASLVHSVDVGTNQLSWKLRRDSRVRVHEKQNVMTLSSLDPMPQASVCDLSFRSISGAAGHILSLCGNTWLVSLIKPQFELPKGQPDFHGVIEDPSLLRDVMLSVYRQLSEEGICVKDVVESPITGRKGNTEYLALLKKGGDALGEKAFLSKL